jgi:CheY-like chemotaxis protein
LVRLIGYQGAQKKILIIDDLSENRYILRQMLAPLGFTILEAKNGLEGLEKVYQESPDLVLTDLVMPVMNGFLAMRKIGEFNVNLPIIAISASIMQSDNEQSPVTGSDAYLAIRLEKLLAQVAKLLQLEWIYN